MSNDEREEERDFLEGLKARTGRDLGQWMAAIAAEGFSDKNEIIDWLRAEGLPFARASWLERIHRNGGKPIYATALPAASAAEGTARSDTQPAAPVPRPEPVSARPASKARENPQAAEPSPNAAEALEKLVSAAKGYRPLYHMLEARIRQAIPDVVVAPLARHVSLGAPHEFAALTLHPTEIRLGLDLGDRIAARRDRLAFAEQARLGGKAAHRAVDAPDDPKGTQEHDAGEQQAAHRQRPECIGQGF